MSPSHFTVPLLGLLASLANAGSSSGNATASSPSIVIGSSPPFDIPKAEFQQYVSQFNASGHLTVPGYNISSTDASGMEQTRDWTVRIVVRGDVPVDSDEGGDGERDAWVKQLTSLSIDAPSPLIIVNEDDRWTMCATVGMGLSSRATREGQGDAGEEGGECGFMSEDCRRDFEDAARNASKECGEIAVPESCKEWFPEGGGESKTFEMTKEILGANRFFSYGSAPTAADNETAYDQAVTNIWPILVSYHHATDGADDGAGESAAALRCLRADQVAYLSREPESVPDRAVGGVSASDEEKGGNGGEGGKQKGKDGENEEDEESGAGGMVGLIGVSMWVTGMVVAMGML